jgi:hypothetical protein
MVAVSKDLGGVVRFLGDFWTVFPFLVRFSIDFLGTFFILGDFRRFFAFSIRLFSQLTCLGFYFSDFVFVLCGLCGLCGMFLFL